MFTHTKSRLIQIRLSVSNKSLMSCFHVRALAILRWKPCSTCFGRGRVMMTQILSSATLAIVGIVQITLAVVLFLRWWCR